MLVISRQVRIPDEEIELDAVRAQGAGGQNVNKVATAIHLRFDIPASSLPQYYKQRLLKLRDARISKEGVVVIKAQRYRSQEKNRADALARLQALIGGVKTPSKKRIATKPSRRARQARLDSKKQRGERKQQRRKVYP